MAKEMTVTYHEKVPADILTNRNGFVMSTREDNGLIGMPHQNDCPYMPLSTGSKMRRGGQQQIFDNNGSTDKSDGGGVVNHNGEYGPISYGY